MNLTSTFYEIWYRSISRVLHPTITFDILQSATASWISCSTTKSNLQTRWYIGRIGKSVSSPVCWEKCFHPQCLHSKPNQLSQSTNIISPRHISLEMLNDMDHNEHANELSPLARHTGLKPIKRHKCFLNRGVPMEICKMMISLWTLLPSRDYRAFL
jgi:hypothetical protein